VGWILAVSLLFLLILVNINYQKDMRIYQAKLNKVEKDFENFKASDPEEKRLRLNFERQLSNIKTITINIKELVNALNYAKKKQTTLDLITDYNTKTIQIAAKGFNATIQGK